MKYPFKSLLLAATVLAAASCAKDDTQSGGEETAGPVIVNASPAAIGGEIILKLKTEASGIVEKSRMLDNRDMAEGDVLIGLASSGCHSNGFSLVRKVFDVEHADLGQYVPELGTTLGEALLTPTVIYVKPVLAAIAAAEVHGVSHITGGGFYENIPRSIPEGLCARIEKGNVRTPAIFPLLQRTGEIPERDMFNTYNMGVGMTLMVSPETADAALRALRAGGCDAYVLGEIVPGEEKIALI